MKKIIELVTNDDIQNGSFVVPEGVAEIGIDAFEDCTSLESITLPAGVKKIGGGAFYRCSRLTNITIPGGVTWIGCDAFNRCSSLKKVFLPKKVKLGYGVFHLCHPDLEIIYRD